MSKREWTPAQRSDVLYGLIIALEDAPPPPDFPNLYFKRMPPIVQEYLHKQDEWYRGKRAAAIAKARVP